MGDVMTKKKEALKNKVFVANRKKLVAEYRRLEMTRLKTNKELRQVRRDMYSLDKLLFLED